MKRLLLALVGLLLGLVLAEGALRQFFVELPSLDALRRSPYASKPFLAGNHRIDHSLDCGGFVSPREDRNATIGEGEPLSLWAIGDSVTWGMGVLPEDSFVHQLAAKIAAEEGRQVVFRNLAMPGAGFCQLVRQLNTGLQAGAPDVLLMGLFADDLEHRAWLAVDGETIGLPDQIQNRQLRWWARRSYVVNLAWFAVAPRTSGERRFVDDVGQRAFAGHMRQIAADMDARGGRLVVVLLSPVGLHRCPPDAPMSERCGWMGSDLDLIAQMLDDAGVEYLDLRGFWDDAPDVSLPAERHFQLAVHPNAEGHARIFQAVWVHYSE